MSKNRASGNREKKQAPNEAGTAVLFRVPKGAELPKDPGSLGSSKRGKASRGSRGWTVDFIPGPFRKRLAEIRKDSDPRSEFARTWDEMQARIARVREAIENPDRLSSTEAAFGLADDASRMAMCYAKLVYSGLTDLAVLALESSADKRKGRRNAQWGCPVRC